MPAAPRVAIVGAGGVGTTLGRRLAAAHHPLRYGVRDLARAAQSEALQSPEAQQLLLPVPDAVGWADVVILSVPGFRTPAAAGALAASLGPGAAGALPGAAAYGPLFVCQCAAARGAPAAA